ncbi:hypothetical protein [Mesorhizobium sp. CAU 1732]|uniref:hypothetical protein n=1 Tax=Mesorhizobium sp. CAU 1732 TaxID=3140358 RepID=UPI0032603767
MRSSLRTAALSAIIVSTSAFGAFAAQTSGMAAMTHNDNRNVQSAYSVPAPSATTGMRTTNPLATMASTQMLPRLRTLMNEISRAEQKINADTQHGRLTRSEHARLAHSLSAIRQQSVATANNHGGAIPKATYGKLRNEVASVDRQIQRLSHDGMRG